MSAVISGISSCCPRVSAGVRHVRVSRGQIASASGRAVLKDGAAAPSLSADVRAV